MCKIPKSFLDHLARAVITTAYVVETQYNGNVSPSLGALEKCITLAVKKHGWRVEAIKFAASGNNSVRVQLCTDGGERHFFIWRNFLND